jgi:hypothetical protein
MASINGLSHCICSSPWVCFGKMAAGPATGAKKLIPNSLALVPLVVAK